MSDEINNFEIFSKCFNCMVVGEGNKNIFINNLLNRIENSYSIVHKFTSLDENKLLQIYNLQLDLLQTRQIWKDLPSILIIYDNVDLRRSNVVKKITVSSKRLGVSQIIISEHLVNIPLVFRYNSNITIMFKLDKSDTDFIRNKFCIQEKFLGFQDKYDCCAMCFDRNGVNISYFKLLTVINERRNLFKRIRRIKKC